MQLGVAGRLHGRELHADDELVGRHVHGEQVLEEAAGLHDPPAFGPFEVNIGVERRHHRGHVCRRVGVRQTAADGAAVAHLRIADRLGALGHHWTPLVQQRRGGDLVVHGAGADHDLAVALADAGEVGDAADVDEELRLAEPQLHQRHQAVAAGDELAGAAGGRDPGQCVVDRGRAYVVECRRNHALPPWPELCRRPGPEPCRGP